MITDNQVQEALDWMIKNEDALAEAKAAYHDLDRFSKTIKAANKPKITNKKVATKLWNAFFETSLKVLSANLHPTEAPNIKRQ